MESQSSKVWFVTGASSGFGRVIVEEAIARGERVVATARDVRALADLVARAGERVLALRLDVRAAGEVARAVAEAEARFGRIDVLVNNAGYSIVGAIEETDDAELRAAMDTMFFGPMALVRAVLPGMRARRSGTIVQMSSMGGLMTAPGYGAYCAVKHALEAASETLAVEVAPHGINVVIVEPGAFRTALFGAGFKVLPPMDAYATTVGPTRAYAAANDGKQPGDPKLAARAIVTHVHDGRTLRLPLGADALAAMRAKLAQVARDFDATEAVALATALAQ